jgi:hypothetical protein
LINSKTIIGENCYLSHNITIGETKRGKLKGSPTFGKKVWIGPGAVIVGSVVIGDNVLIAPLCYVNIDVPSNSIVMGNHDIDQIHWLKHRYQHQVISISCSYDTYLYDQMLTYQAKMHIYRQSIGDVPLTEDDLQVRSNPKENLTLYYKAAFDRLNMLPRKLQYNTDIVIPCEDFLIMNKFFKHIVDLGGTLTDNVILYYKQWYQNQIDFLSIGTNYENI